MQGIDDVPLCLAIRHFIVPHGNTVPGEYGQQAKGMYVCCCVGLEDHEHASVACFLGNKYRQLM